MHVIVGSGPIGSSVARLLADRGEKVRMVTRSGSGPDHELVERVAGDAADARRLTELSAGAEVVYNCANPRYTEWEQKWFPMNDAMIAAAKATGAVYAITGNLYVYGPQPGGHMREDTPMAAVGRKGKVRIRMWQDALASGVRTVEARGADYLGAGAIGLFSAVLLPAIANRRTPWVPGNPDAPHTFTYTGDMAHTLVTLALDERAWGRAWHVPSPDPVSIRELADRYCDLTGAPRLAMRRLPRWMNHAAGRFNPMLREMAEMDYQFYFPFRLDSTLTAQTFGLTATPLEVGLRETAEDATRIAARTM